MPFFFSEIAQELAHAGVGCPSGCRFVKALGFQLHQLGLFLHRLEAERPYQPDRRPAHKAAHVLPANQWDMLAEPRAVKIQQTMTMGILVLPHAGELFGLLRMILRQGLREIVVADVGQRLTAPEGEALAEQAVGLLRLPST